LKEQLVQNIIADVIHEGKQNWGWYMALGIALIVIGFVAIGSDVVGATLASMAGVAWSSLALRLKTANKQILSKS
jgi:uncharacterized membrane protein HdeD (DUF308 family)